MPQRGRLRVSVFVCAVVAACVILFIMVYRLSTTNGKIDALQQHVLVLSEQLHAPGDNNSLTVATSTLSIAQHMRYQIQQYLLAGKSDRQIITLMEQTYGRNVLSTPRFHGFGTLVWVAPFVVVCAAFAAAFYYVRRWSGTKSQVASEGSASSHAHGAQEVANMEMESQLRDYL